MSLGRYLQSCRAGLATMESKNAFQGLTIVVGNESADLDSCVSSIAYGYLQTSKGTSQETIVPVLNLAREDIKLRAELLLLLKASDISEADLICRDELSSEVKQKADQIAFVLVDHNNFRVEGFSRDSIRVSGIIDHHVDEGLYRNAVPRVIEPCGSCTSLVIKHFKELWEKDQIEGESQLTKMAISAILVDTDRLTNQATETDFNMVNFLRSRLVEIQGWNEADQFAALRTAKRDITGLSVSQLLRRDYKEWDLGADVGLWGVSSVTTSLSKLTKMPKWLQDAESHAKGRHLDVHIIMTKHGEKELFINVVNPRVSEYVSRFIDQATTEMLLKYWKEEEFQGPSLYAFQQGELSATRKTVATIVQSIK